MVVNPFDAIALRDIAVIRTAVYIPWRQRAHRPQPAWTSTVTRSPIAYSSTDGPSLTTVPYTSWPIVKFLLNGSPPSTIAGRPWAMISRSVAQIETASMRTGTSAEPGCGTSFSGRQNLHPGPPSTHAFIVSRTGYSLLNRAASTIAVSPSRRELQQCSARRHEEKVWSPLAMRSLRYRIPAS